MQPQNGQQIRQHHQPQPPPLPAVIPPAGFDSSSYYNLDASAAAKQIAALNAANRTRKGTNSRPMPQPPTAISSGPYPGGASSINHPINPSHDTPNATGHSNFHIPSHNGSASFPNSSHVDPSVAQQNAASRNSQAAASLKHRRRSFLMGLANLMSARNTPLPPALTGIPYPPNYDPTNSPWKIIEPSPSEPGFFRLAGKDIDLFKLWGLVFQAGGGAKLNTQPGAWNLLLSHFDLPEQFPVPQPNGASSVATTLSQYYMALLHPFEDAYKRNIQEQQRRAIEASRQPGAQSQQPSIAGPAQGRLPQTALNGVPQTAFPGQMQATASLRVPSSMNQSSLTGSPLNGVSQYPQPSTVAATPQPRPPSSPADIQPSHGNSQSSSSGVSSDPITLPGQSFARPPSEKDILDPDVQGIKRKLDSEEADSKRVRQKTAESEPPEGSSSSTVQPDRNSPNHSNVPNGSSSTIPPPPKPRPQPSRRKIEYVPLAREIDTFGGRDLNAINEELVRLRERRPLRDINDWGNVDIEALTMSIRSRLSTELSYALTTFTLLSTMKGQNPGSGFPIYQCVDLLDEVLDLLEDEAFGDEDVFSPEVLGDFRVTTHRELVNIIHEEGSQPFAGLTHWQGSKDPDIGPLQRPGNLVLAVMNILRNLSTVADNVTFLAQHERLLDIVLHVCDLKHDGSRPSAASSVLSLGDLVAIRKDVLYTLTNIAGLIQLSSNPGPSKTMVRVARRAFSLISSYLVDPAECLSPLAYLQHLGPLPSGGRKPPSLPDTALEVFTRLSQSDSNRQVLSQTIPQTAIWHLFEAMVHRLPVLDADFQLVLREYWLSYLEKIIMAIYSLSFLAPPELKQKFKTHRSLGFTKVMLRMVQKFLMNPNPDGRAWFSICTRRAIEAMKVVDDGEDSFDTSQSTTQPTMSFGMGYGEVGESEKEKGTGMLGGHRDVTWDLLMLREVDNVMFAELESLTRVE